MAEFNRTDVTGVNKDRRILKINKGDKGTAGRKML